MLIRSIRPLVWPLAMPSIATCLFAVIAVAQDEPATPPGKIDQYKRPDQIAADAFGPPPAASAIAKTNLWIDRAAARVYCDGYVAMREGPLEMFACPAGTKEHESIVATIARSKEVHTALLAVGATKGTPVRVIPDYLPATGQRIRVWAAYRDAAGEFQCVDARQWILGRDDKTMDVDWVFAGSSLWTDPSDNTTYYQADGGDMICVSNFSTAMMDVPVASPADASELIYRPKTDAIPPRGTPVRLILQPIPVPPAHPPAKPGADVLPAK